MKTKRFLSFAVYGISFILFSAIFSSCVSKKTFRATENSMMAAETNLLKARKQISDLEKDTTELSQSLRLARQQIKELEQYNEYVQNTLYKQMNTKTADIDEKNDRISELNKELRITRRSLKEVTAENKKNTEQLLKVEKRIKAQNAIINNLRLSVATALAEINDPNIEFVARDGTVRIIIQEQVLFPANGTSLKSSGSTTLMSIANTVAMSQNFKVLVETHADDNPKRNNWDFTSKRAAQIAEFLVKGGVNPNQVVLSAKGAFSPIALNDNAENRTKNRRIEIVLSPSFYNMFEVLKMY